MNTETHLCQVISFCKMAIYNASTKAPIEKAEFKALERNMLKICIKTSEFYGFTF